MNMSRKKQYNTPKKKNKAKHSSLCACKECDPDGIRIAFAKSMGEEWDY